jgi:hypothetical protein
MPVYLKNWFKLSLVAVVAIGINTRITQIVIARTTAQGDELLPHKDPYLTSGLCT